MEFGSIVDIKEKYKRVWGTRPSLYPNGSQTDASTKEWVRTPEISKNCIFLGFRTLRNGWNYYEHEAGYVFKPIEIISAALVCTGPNKNPIYVPLDSIEAS